MPEITTQSPGLYRRDLAAAHFLRKQADIVGIGQCVLGEAAVDRVTGVALRLAQRLPATQAVFAMATRRVQPGDADPVAFPDVPYPASHGHDVPHALVAGDEWRVRFHRPVALGGVQVGVAYATGLDPDQYLARPRARYRDFLDHQWFAELTHDSGLHGWIDVRISVVSLPTE
ncbi:hypothetical protein G6F63_013907 [Rhizopus arrhizus]|nr:hypothetical protein G6F63_013907 [Rhizopus arrhizus]